MGKAYIEKITTPIIVLQIMSTLLNVYQGVRQENLYFFSGSEQLIFWVLLTAQFIVTMFVTIKQSNRPKKRWAWLVAIGTISVGFTAKKVITTDTLYSIGTINILLIVAALLLLFRQYKYDYVWKEIENKKREERSN
ncbi:hypothetical protein [uncultured Vagococcus sp.]|uniref:hypothetical protein n=1 Tax=uncultured Vagococcus sp. TaxID=189676 RepID=UPI0028D631E9|nr:hypothetical protein [uncultured Vagococcus sp.]